MKLSFAPESLVNILVFFPIHQFHREMLTRIISTFPCLMLL